MAIDVIAIGFRDPSGHNVLREAWHGIGMNMSHGTARGLHVLCYATPIAIVRLAVS